MKTIKINFRFAAALLLATFMLLPGISNSQEPKEQVMDQNISIYAEDEPLSDIIEKICK